MCNRINIKISLYLICNSAIRQILLNMIHTYGIINIIYATTTGNSKELAYQFSQQARRFSFLTKITNLGDFDPQIFIKQKFIVLFLSTYGNGGSPESGHKFYQWLIQYSQNKTNSLKHLKFIMFGLGNSSFEYFCGFSNEIRKRLLKLQAQQIYEFGKSDITIEKPIEYYNKWKQNLFETILKEKSSFFIKKQYSIDQIKKLNTNYSVKYSEGENQDWQNFDINKIKLQHQFKQYFKYPKVKILEIKELRKLHTETEKRSTLLIKIQKFAQLSVATNFTIIPQNIILEHQYKGIIEIQSTQQVPFPPMPLKQLMKLLNISGKITKSFLQEVLLTCTDTQKLKYYSELLKDNFKWNQMNITNQQICKQFNLKFEDKLILGINQPRFYTLANWNQNYIELIVSIVQKNGKIGLASNYFIHKPNQIRINPTPSTFQIPQCYEVPIIMIANGSGMAPFRSILHYMIEKKKRNQPTNPLIFYFGCQQVDNDFYFKQQWELAESENLVKLHIATSRQGEKIYIQKLFQRNISEIRKLLFEQQATIMICGSSQMSKDINSIIISAIKLNGTKPYLALMKLKELEKQRRIQKQLFG